MERNYAPVIVFSFSKKDCEAYATQMAKLDFNTGEQMLYLIAHTCSANRFKNRTFLALYLFTGIE